LAALRGTRIRDRQTRDSPVRRVGSLEVLAEVLVAFSVAWRRASAGKIRAALHLRAVNPAVNLAVLADFWAVCLAAAGAVRR